MTLIQEKVATQTTAISYAQTIWLRRKRRHDLICNFDVSISNDDNIADKSTFTYTLNNQNTSVSKMCTITKEL